MISSIDRESLGFKFKVSNVPETVEEFDSAAKRDGACLASAIANEMFRGVNGDFRSDLCEAVEKQTGQPRKSEPVRAAKENETEDDVPTRYTETEAAYINRVVAAGAITKDEIQTIASAITIDFDPSVREKKASEPKVGKQMLASAQKAIDEGKGEKLAGKLKSLLGDAHGPIDHTDHRSLAKALIADKKRRETEQANELGL